ncbi:MAG: hypothetical protein AUF60_07530 [Gemmatimonadetes bacterium 13_1_20CM_69_28]|nr:MAG: hypothetical protein AUF60_07530 [Gemmatimonadetes bacterium 13_1_20CM_69_28]
MEPGFTFQFVFCDSLDHVQELLCDEALEFAEGLLLEYHPHLFFFAGCALAENQLSNFFKQGLGRIVQISLQYFLTLMIRQLRKIAAWELQEFPHLVVNVCPARFRGQFFASQQLRNVGLRDLGGGRQISLLQPQFFKPPLDHQANIHKALHVA